MAKRKLPVIDEGDFREGIDQALQKERHVDYLQQVLQEYSEYQRVFSENFTDTNPLKAAYYFRVKFIYDRPIWRDIVLWGNQTFYDLAYTIIEWMEWENDHMHGFSLKKVNGEVQHRFSRFSMYAPEWEDDPHPTFKTNEVRIADIDYVKQPKLGFVFDFGDGHEFDIELKRIDEKARAGDFDELLPTCVDQRGVAPLQYPENSLMPKNFKNFLDEHSENCPHCKLLKDERVDLQWYGDEPELLPKEG